jgi:uncharacterized protein YdeI (YjbR/CyaY-like superfamily)
MHHSNQACAKLCRALTPYNKLCKGWVDYNLLPFQKKGKKQDKEQKAWKIEDKTEEDKTEKCPFQLNLCTVCTVYVSCLIISKGVNYVNDQTNKIYQPPNTRIEKFFSIL